MGTITVKLKRGTNGCTRKQKDNVKGLGLTKRGAVRTLEDTPAIRGMIKKVIHLLEINR